METEILENSLLFLNRPIPFFDLRVENVDPTLPTLLTTSSFDHLGAFCPLGCSAALYPVQ